MRKFQAWMLAAVAAGMAFLAGCQPAAMKSTGGVLGEDGLSVLELADRLGLMVRSSSNGNVTLADRLNSVMIFSGSQGQAYVNGQAVGAAGGIVQVDGVMYVPHQLEGEIRASLRRFHPSPVRQVKHVWYPKVPKTKPVVIDPGHGGKDPGAIGCNGVREKDVNLRIARRVTALLRQQGVEVRMTRNSDSFMELNDRAEVSNQVNARLFVSIHADSARNSAARGYTVFIPASRCAQSNPLASGILREFASTGMVNRGTRKADYRVLRLTKCPAVLVETGFLSNRLDARKLASDEYQLQCAVAISKGILEFLSH